MEAFRALQSYLYGNRVRLPDRVCSLELSKADN